MKLANRQSFSLTKSPERHRQKWRCFFVAVLNMHLNNSTSEAFVESDEHGICQIAVYDKTVTEK